MNPPNGIDEIVATFGDVREYIGSDGHLMPTWEANYLDHVNLPFHIPLSFDLSSYMTRLLCHKLMVKIFEQVFQDIVTLGLQNKVTDIGGCFAFRQQRTGTKLSTHAWGIAIDLNANENQQGSTGSIDPNLVTIFESSGFEWGGRWPLPRKDSMHFQFCSGY